jgi:cell wall-associated NlpC family hydrolase
MNLTKLFFFLLIFLTVFKGNISAQFSSNQKCDMEIMRKFIQSTPRSTVDSNMVKAARFFLNTPYVANTLDTLNTEELIINFREIDCLTFVENCLALSRMIMCPNPDMDCFERELKMIRYRDGILNGYTSRLHYTSDWIFDNVKKGILNDVTHDLGGQKFKPDVSFMSENSQKYKHLKNNPKAVAEIKAIEQEINRRENYCFIPKHKIETHQYLIKSGDIICFTTSIHGLDISHVGIAYRHNGQLTFIHASLNAKKVIINPESLVNYCKKIKSNTGIIVLRLSPYNPVKINE